MSDVELLTVGQAAKRLGISEEAVRRRIERGTLPSLKRGRARLIPRHAVEYALAQDTGTTLDDDDVASVGVGGSGGSERGTSDPTSTELVKAVSEALERVAVEVEKRVNAERDRDAVAERERSERQAREAADAEVLQLRALLVQAGIDPAKTVLVDEAATDAASTVGPVRRAWWQRMLGGDGRQVP
jgi:excisionase family DNA binding protein